MTGGTDPVSGLYRMTAEASDMFWLQWEVGGQAHYTTSLRSYTFGTKEAISTIPGAVTLDYVLADGTKIRLVNSGARVEVIPQYNVVVISVDFVLSDEAVSAFASSPPTFRRWTIAGKTFDQERSTRQGEKYYRPMFGCVMAGIDKYSDDGGANSQPGPEPDPVTNALDPTSPPPTEVVPEAVKPRGGPLMIAGGAGVVVSGTSMFIASRHAAAARSAQGAEVYDSSVQAARAAETAGWVTGAAGLALVGTGVTLRFAGESDPAPRRLPLRRVEPTLRRDG